MEVRLSCGLLDEGETPMACALGEAHEEFGLIFYPERLVDLGRHPYYPGKDLHLFAARTTSAETDIEHCRCRSVFEHPKTGQIMPEVDGFPWSDDTELATRLARSMKRILDDRHCWDSHGSFVAIHDLLIHPPSGSVRNQLQSFG